MLTLDEAKRMVERLSADDRKRVARWIATLDAIEPAVEDRVAEPAAVYRVEPRVHMTVDEYLEFELASEEKHEYVAGHVRAMCGVSVAHNTIGVNLVHAFKNHIKDGPCRVYANNLMVRLQVQRSDVIYYPDIMVACRDLDAHKYFMRSPVFIAEVLSPSTRSIDLHEKRLSYPFIESLEEYVTIEQHRCGVCIYRRRDDWRPVVLESLEEIAHFRSIQLSLPVRDIYDGVTLERAE